MTNYVEPGSGACERYEALLEDYLNGELNANEAKFAADHWENCVACKTALKSAAESVKLLRLAEPSADPGLGFARRVMARIRAAESELLIKRANYWQPFVALGWRFTATATLAVAVLVSYNAGWGHPAQPKTAELRPTVDIFAPEPVRAPLSGDEVLILMAENGHAKF
jgi:anti-sigma factor RsiW